MFLETTDGVAILGYAGLGATARGTEPSDWMSAVLRGTSFSLEQSLGALAEAMKRQFPPHMVGMLGDGGPSHTVLVPAFLGREPRLYTIGLALTPDRKSYASGCTRMVNRMPLDTSRPPPIVMTGSGGLYLSRQKDQTWRRSLLRMVRANDRGQESPHAVADCLAKLNKKVHGGISDKSVGPNCIVAWRHRNGGGEHQSYTGTTRDNRVPVLPTIMTGFDVKALAAIHMAEWLKARRAGQPVEEPNKPNKEEINARLARLPDKPDENLR
jgi:hypothetical protein